LRAYRESSPRWEARFDTPHARLVELGQQADGGTSVIETYLACRDGTTPALDDVEEEALFECVRCGRRWPHAGLRKPSRAWLLEMGDPSPPGYCCVCGGECVVRGCLGTLLDALGRASLELGLALARPETPPGVSELKNAVDAFLATTRL